MRRRPLRHFSWLLHYDIERDHEAENDRKEVDRQRRDVGCGAVREGCQNVAQHCQRHGRAEHDEDREYCGRWSAAGHLAASVWIGDLKRSIGIAKSTPEAGQIDFS